VECCVKVYVRTRPPSTINGTSCVEVRSDLSTIHVHPPPSNKGPPKQNTSTDEFFFDSGVLDPQVSQHDMFEAVGRPAADSVMEGFNVTIFAYGQTGSGKTHTIYGYCSSGSNVADINADTTGLSGRIMDYIVTTCGEKKEEKVKYRYSLSMLDIYDEKVTDLFDPPHEKKVREGANGTYVEGSKWKSVLSGPQAQARLQEALQGRKVCFTAMNSTSSRSHTICMFRVSRDEEREDGEVVNRSGIITIVDLCGSERVKKSEVDGSRLKEAININASLSSLKTVLTAIGDSAGHVPYRSSKLTWLLKDCIGGNARVIIIAHVNPCCLHHWETLSTLRFVSMVKTVKTYSSKNTHVKTKAEMQEEEEDESLAAEAKSLASFEQVKSCEVSTQVSPGRDVLRETREAMEALKENLRSGNMSEDDLRQHRDLIMKKLNEEMTEIAGVDVREESEEEVSADSEEEEGGGGESSSIIVHVQGRDNQQLRVSISSSSRASAILRAARQCGLVKRKERVLLKKDDEQIPLEATLQSSGVKHGDMLSIVSG